MSIPKAIRYTAISDFRLRLYESFFLNILSYSKKILYEKLLLSSY